jgi:nucleotide-binding universal stress UspA family protein
MKIVVATDGSRAGSAALRFASNLVRGQGSGELVVVTVCPGRSSASARSNGDGPVAQARRVLADASRVVQGRVPSVRFELISSRSADEVPEAISRYADRQRADLVVVGSEGRESLTEWVVGGTALRLIYVARRPVTVVRAPRVRSARTTPVV